MIFPPLTLAEPLSFSTSERLLFLALVAVSIFGFFHRFGPILSKILQSKKDPGFHLSPSRQAGARLRLGGAAPGQGDPRAAAGRASARAGLLGLLRLCAGHAEPLRGDFRARLSRSGRACRAVLLRFCGAVSLRPAPSGSSGCLCGDSLPGPSGWAKLSWGSGLVALLIFVLMVTYLAAFFVPATGAAGACAVVGAHAYAARVSAGDSAYQASAPGSEPVYGFSLARRLRAHSSARGRRGLRARRRQRSHSPRQPAGLLLRGVRPLHGALPGQQYGQAAQPEGNRARAARLSE